jgi:uncharacterized Zn finger protein
LSRYGYGGYGYGGWAPYVPVAERRRKALKKMEALRKKGIDVQPVQIDGRKIARSFWGEAWCEHLESFSDYENRLPRGRTYVRNGSVCHLAVAKGRVEAKVSGSELYDVKVTIKTLPGRKWTFLKGRCSGQIGSLLELLQGRLSDHVLEVVTHREEGLFPLPGEMSFTCSCPDSAKMCKHVAAVLYGVGARLDNKPELLFSLRGVDHEELITADAENAVTAATARGKSKRLAESELSEVFGIDLAPEVASPPAKESSKGETAASPTKTTPPAKRRTVRRTTTAPKPRGTRKAATPRRKRAVKKNTNVATPIRGTVVNLAKAAKKMAGATTNDKARKGKRQSPRPKAKRHGTTPPSVCTTDGPLTKPPIS